LLAFGSKPNTTPLLCLVAGFHPSYISNMMFDNELSNEPTLRSQLHSHLPIAALAIALLALFVAMHVAAIGLVLLAAGHLVVGVGLVAGQRFRARSGTK